MFNRKWMALAFFGLSYASSACPIFEGQVFSRYLGKDNYDSPNAHFSTCSIKVLGHGNLQVETTFVFQGKRILGYQTIFNNLHVGPEGIPLEKVLAAASLDPVKVGSRPDAILLNTLPEGESDLIFPLWTQTARYNFSPNRTVNPTVLLENDPAKKSFVRNSKESHQLIRWIQNTCGVQDYYNEGKYGRESPDFLSKFQWKGDYSHKFHLKSQALRIVSVSSSPFFDQDFSGRSKRDASYRCKEREIF